MQNYFKQFSDIDIGLINSKYSSSVPILPLHTRISWQGRNILLDGKTVFSVPFNGSCQGSTDFNLVGILEDAQNNLDGCVVAGTGNCCYGHFYHFNYNINNNYLELENIITLDTNVQDIIPILPNNIILPSSKNFNYLISGVGCSQKGLRLVSRTNSNYAKILSSFEYSSISSEPKPLLLAKDNTISLCGYNINSILQDADFDILGSIEKNKRFYRL